MKSAGRKWFYPSPHQPFQSVCRPTVRTTSTELRIFEIRQNASYANATESLAKLSHCFWTNVNSDLTSAHRPSSFKPCGIGVEFRANLRLAPIFSGCLTAFFTSNKRYMPRNGAAWKNHLLDKMQQMRERNAHHVGKHTGQQQGSDKFGRDSGGIP